MGKLKQLKAIYSAINAHPLAGRHKLLAYRKFIWWQLLNLVNPKERKVKFLDHTFLLVKKSMTGATGNIYLGLHEFPDMAFLLHFLRKGDMFYDIGANIGSYTVLAAGEAGAQVIAFEPIPSTFQGLNKNIFINKIASLVKAINVGVGAQAETLVFSKAYDTINHVIPAGQTTATQEVIEVPVVAIDDIATEVNKPVLVKIDVEGFETEVLNGMDATLKDLHLKGIIIELNGSGGRYGYDENLIHHKLVAAGFGAYEYEPFNRSLHEIREHGKFNTLYLRDTEFVKKRILSASKIDIFSESF